MQHTLYFYVNQIKKMNHSTGNHEYLCILIEIFRRIDNALHKLVVVTVNILSTKIKFIEHYFTEM